MSFIVCFSLLICSVASLAHAQVGDFGNGHADLIWQNVQTGERAVWLMNGLNVISSEVFATVPSEWQLVE